MGSTCYSLNLLVLLCTVPVLTYSGFTINSVSLSLQPAEEVESGTDVTLHCSFSVSRDQNSSLTYWYGFYKGDTLVYSKNSSEEQLVHRLSQARASSSGIYRCQVRIADKEKRSGTKQLRVTGIQQPILHLSQQRAIEGGRLKATCRAPEESGMFTFFFYLNGSQVTHVVNSNNSALVEMSVDTPGLLATRCRYSLFFIGEMRMSDFSNTLRVFVEELQVVPNVTVVPSPYVTEGDRLEVRCAALSRHPSLSPGSSVYLIRGSSLLKTGQKEATWATPAAGVEDSGEYQCKWERGEVQKMDRRTVQVAELFSVPILSMAPKEVFERDRVTLSCHSTRIASVRIGRRDVVYKLYKDNKPVPLNPFNGTYSFSSTVHHNGNYSCQAEAKGIRKRSPPIILKTKVLVTVPRIYTPDIVIVGKPFRVHCQCERGSLPISYTLMKRQQTIHILTLRSTNPAAFNVSIQTPEEVQEYQCEAQNNGHTSRKISNALNATVIRPVSHTQLRLSHSEEVEEGQDVQLLCSTESGSLPITFRWYHNDREFAADTVSHTHSSQSLSVEGQQQGGTYYCDASNRASKILRSQAVKLTVTLATWKKAVIGSCSLLVLAVAAACFIWLRAKRGRRKAKATELSVKATGQDTDAATVSLTHGSAIYTAAVGEDEEVRKTVWGEETSDSASVSHSSGGSMEPNEEERLEEPDVEYADVMCSHPRETHKPESGVSNHRAEDSVEYAQLNYGQQEAV